MANKMNRRNFLTCTAAVGAASLVGTSSVLTSCTGSAKAPKLVPLKQPGEYYVPELMAKAIDGPVLKIGVIGCGGRSSGAFYNLLQAAGETVKLHAVADVFADKIASFRTKAKEWGHEIADDMCFVGFDAYKKVIDSGVDAVIVATPPAFRPSHFEYATEKGVHSFLEKPVAVDPKGCRSVIKTARIAQSKGLSVVCGTQRHHQAPYVQAYELIQQGYIGEITGGNVYWNDSQLWYRTPQPGVSQMENMIRDWVNWKWLSGDHIVEQHVHNIDVFLWMTGLVKPVSATAFGSRQRRVTGDQYDNFSTDFVFENGIHLHSMCRQIDGCSNNVSETIHGTKGYWSSTDHAIRDLQGNIIWQYDKEAMEEKITKDGCSGYVQEHIDWINHIRKGEMLDEATQCATSTLAGVLAREAAYTGKTLTWDEIVASPMDLMPEKLELGKVDTSDFFVRVPGSDKK